MSMSTLLLQGKPVARSGSNPPPLQQQAHHNLKRDLQVVDFESPCAHHSTDMPYLLCVYASQHQEISSSQVSEASESMSKRHKKISVIKDPIYFK